MNNKSLWQTLNGLCKKNRQFHDRVNELYSRISFPYKIRGRFAEWIEEQDWDLVDLEEDSGKRKAENLYKELVMKIEGNEDGLQAGQGFDLEKTLDLGRAKDSLKKAFDGNYCTFVRVIQKCLGEERLLIESCEIDNNEVKRKVKVADPNVETMEIQLRLTELQNQVALIGQKIEDVQFKQGKFRMDFEEKGEKLKQLNAQLSKGHQAELARLKADIEREQLKGSTENFENRKDMSNSLLLAAANLNEILSLIWREIEKWNVEQKREITALSKPVEGALDRLDKLCNEVGDVLIKMIQHLNNALNIILDIKYNPDQCVEDLQQALKGVRYQLLPEHLQKAFVVERNIPDRVLKVSSGKSLGFSMSVRILGGSGLGLSFAPPKVSVSLFHEKSIPPGVEQVAGACQILNGHERTFAINRGTNSFTAHFHSVQLKNVKRPDRGKNEELVTEHKYAFVFYSTVTVSGEPFQLRVVSLPVILTSQTSQEIMAKGTLIWHAAFSEGVDVGKNLFEYKDTVPWGEVAKVLNALFLQNTGRSLIKENLQYLAKMAFRHKDSRRSTDAVDFDSKVISEKQVIRDRLSGRDFSFWKWFYACMNLVIYHVKKEWQDGRIYGFISKEDCKRTLKDCPCGTFLLRFSESNIENSQKSDICGYLTVAVMEIDPESGQKKLFHVKDYLSPKEIHEKGLAPILDAMEVAEFTDPSKKKRLLQFLFPDRNTKFEDVFGTYIKQKECSEDGYRRGKYSIEIFLTDEQGRRGRHDSIDGSACDAGSCPPSVQSMASINSPIYEDWSEAPPGTYDMTHMNTLMLQMPLNAAQRPLAAVRPHFPSAVQPSAVAAVGPYNQPQEQLFNMAQPDMFGGVTQDFLTPFFSNGQIIDDTSLEAMLMTDNDGDLVIAPEFSGRDLRFS